MNDHSFQPDWASPPGDTINDVLCEKGISAATFASRINLSISAANKLLSGTLELTPEIARSLSELLGATDNFWLNREQQYRSDLSRLEEESELSQWLEDLPVKEMIKLGWIKGARSLKEKAQVCLDFFEVKDVASWHLTYKPQLDAVAFRTSESFNSSPGAVISWLRQAELESSKIDTSSWSQKKFQQALTEARPLTRKKEPNEFLPQLQILCAAAGVAVVIVRSPPGCRASGATRFLSEDKALLALSFRYLSDDHFWFTFFHEAAHLLLHSKDLTFIETGETQNTAKEIEANRFSENFLIPIDRQNELRSLGSDYKKILRFARSIGISPGIVVGQMQHKKLLRQNQLNSLKKRYRWS